MCHKEVGNTLCKHLILIQHSLREIHLRWDLLVSFMIQSKTSSRMEAGKSFHIKIFVFQKEVWNLNKTKYFILQFFKEKKENKLPCFLQVQWKQQNYFLSSYELCFQFYFLPSWIQDHL